MVKDKDTKMFHASLTYEDRLIIERMGWGDGRCIGSGCFGSVYITIRGEKDICAVKLIKLHPNSSLEECSREIKLLIDTNHPNIINIYEIYLLDNSSSYLLFMEFCHGGNLGKFMMDLNENKEDKIGEYEGARFYLQIGGALKYCHQRGICHRDLKPANILLDQYKTICKIGDWGQAVQDFELTTGKQQNKKIILAGDPMTYPPEYQRDFEKTSFIQETVIDCTKADVWSLGLIFFYMIDGYRYQKPLFGYNQFNIHNDNEIARIKAFDNIIKNIEFRNLKVLSNEAKQFLMIHLTYDDYSRPSMERLLKEEYLDRAGSFIPKLCGGETKQKTTPQKIKELIKKGISTCLNSKSKLK